MVSRPLPIMIDEERYSFLLAMHAILLASVNG